MNENNQRIEAEVCKVLEKLKEMRVNHEIKKYRNLVDALGSLLSSHGMRFSTSIANADYVNFLQSTIATLKNERSSLLERLSTYLSHESLNIYKDSIISYEKLNKIYSSTNNELERLQNEIRDRVNSMANSFRKQVKKVS